MMDTANAVDPSGWLQREARTFQFAGHGLGYCPRFHVGVDALAVSSPNVIEERDQLVGGLVIHECAASLSAGEQPLGLHHMERLAAHAKGARQVPFVETGGARFAIAD
jgi:hypothetical protein